MEIKVIAVIFPASDFDFLVYIHIEFLLFFFGKISGEVE